MLLSVFASRNPPKKGAHGAFKASQTHTNLRLPRARAEDWQQATLRKDRHALLTSTNVSKAALETQTSGPDLDPMSSYEPEETKRGTPRTLASHAVT